MRVLLIDVNCKNSSTGKIVYDLFKELKSDGNEVALCYGRGKQINEIGVFKFGLDWETYIHAGLSRLTGLNGYFSYFSTKKLLKFIDEFKPDIINIHELHAYFVNFKPVLNYIAQKNIKTIYTFHCEYMYTGKCGNAIDCEAWKSGCKKCKYIRRYPTSLFFDFTRKMYLDKREALLKIKNLKIVTPSQWLADRVKHTFLKEKEIDVIHNGVNLSEFHYHSQTLELRNKLGISEKEKVVIAIASNVMSKAKGGEHILALAKKMENTSTKFILVGAKKKHISHNIIMLTTITDSSLLSQYYSLADVFIMCSINETFSMTCAESLCCGTPVVAFCAGAPETIFKKPYALFVKYGDYDELEKNVRLRLSTGLISRKKCIKYGVENFSKDVMCDKYSELYKKTNRTF